MSQASPASTPIPEKSNLERSDTARTDNDSFRSGPFDRNMSTASPVASVTSDAQRSTKQEERRDPYASFGPASLAQDVPGAFPRESPTPLQQMQTGESNLSGAGKTNRADPFGSTSGEQPRAGKVDFDAAFAGFGPSRQNTSTVPANKAPVENTNRFNKEFPPIEDLTHDDDSDSNDGRGFDDNFTSASPQQKRISSGLEQQRPGTASTTDDLYSRPAPASRMESTLSELPTPGAQKPPPSYESSVPKRTGSNQFPPEFGGLLPSREVPGSPETSQGPEKSLNPPGGHGAALFGGPSKPATTSPPPLDTPSSTVPSDAYHSAASYGTSDTNKPADPSAGRFNDDFDAGFDDLTDAKEDDKTDDDFMFASHASQADEFNPVFDSPAASKSNTMASQATPKQRGGAGGDDSFSDFEHLSQHFGGQGKDVPKEKEQDWDAIFGSLDNSQSQPQTQQHPHPQPMEFTPVQNLPQGPADFAGKTSSPFDTAPAGPSASSHLSPTSSQHLSPTTSQHMPPLGRAISTGTEHDDPILKKLTAMGYQRGEALDALEKFDYDINKVSAE
jgi:epidermal growth factor receptor substrate 15